MTEETVNKWQAEFLLMQKDLAHIVENQASTNHLYQQSIEKLEISNEKLSENIQRLTDSQINLQKALEELPQLRHEIRTLQDTQIAQASIIEGVKDIKKFISRALLGLVFSAITVVVAQSVVGANNSKNSEDIKLLIKSIQQKANKDSK